jgi:hypothetical protein
LCSSILATCPLRQMFMGACCWHLDNPDDSIITTNKWVNLVESVPEFAADVSVTIARNTLTTSLSQSREKKPHPYDTPLTELEIPFGNAFISAISNRQPVVKDIDEARKLLKVLDDNIETGSLGMYMSRENTKWPHSNPSVEAMRKAGWFHYPGHGSQDGVRCIHCSTTPHNWGGVDSIEAHKR